MCILIIYFVWTKSKKSCFRKKRFIVFSQKGPAIKVSFVNTGKIITANFSNMTTEKNTAWLFTTGINQHVLEKLGYES